MTFIKKLKPLLFQSGLSESEVVVYLTLLKKPACTIFELIQRTGLRQSTIYWAFERLQKLKMVEKNKDGIRALSLKGLIAELHMQKRKADKISYKLKQIAPFLHAPREASEEFETFYTADQIADVYLTMAEIPYTKNFDFGDFENFITVIGPIELSLKFREKRAKHATHEAIVTTWGPQIAFFCNKEDEKKYKNRFDFAPHINFKKHWIIFSDTNDTVLFTDVSEPEFPSAVLVKSKPIADMQRLNFKNFSKMI